MENHTPQIAVASRYKKAFREWLESLPWANNIPAHILISSGRVIIVGLPMDMFGDEDWFEQFIQDNFLLFFQMELEIFIPEDVSEEELDRYGPKDISYEEYLYGLTLNIFSIGRPDDVCIEIVDVVHVQRHYRR
jgi:hypothetical protein